MTLSKACISRCTFRAAALALLTAALAAPPAWAEEIAVGPGKKSLQQAFAEAKAGATIVLPEGTTTGAVALPPGVSLRGAGYDRTTLDVGGGAVGVSIKGGKGSRVEDLTVRTTGGVALSATATNDLKIRRVRLLGGALGLQLRDVEGGRVENAIIAGAMVGASLSRVRHAALVNCTIASASSIGLSLADVEDAAVFNNLIAEAGTGVMLGGARRGLHLDYNLYRALYAGKVEGQIARVSIGPWRDATGGLDAHSVNLEVRFAGAEAGDFRPVSGMDWDPSRATTADWGAADLGGFKAPTADIDGAPRRGPVDVGAYEAAALSAPPADGTFQVADDEGTKSAGVFRPDGTLVRYLFHDLPLKKGTYGFVLAARTQLGDRLTPGDYEVRVVESRLGWEYRGMTGNSGTASGKRDTDENHLIYVRFGADGSLLTANGWNERGENLRSRDLKTDKANWVFNGSAETVGLCVGADKMIYLLRPSGVKDTYSLSRIDSTTGKPVLWADPKQGSVVLPDAGLDGLDDLDGVLYLADSKNDKVYYGSEKEGSFGKSFAVKAPSQPAADPRRKVLWLLSGTEKLVAVSPTGDVIAESTDVRSPVGVAVNGDRLAVASAEDGKAHFFDCSDPKKLKSLKTLGRGDGPYGPVLADRFHFQTGPYNPVHKVSLALDADGRLALRDATSRLVVLADDGKPLHSSIAQFGNQPTPGHFAGDEKTRVFDHVGRFSWWIDAKAGTWAPDAYWGLPPNLSGGDTVIGYFSAGGKNFGVFHAQYAVDEKNKQPAVLFVRFENHVGRPVLLYTPGKDGGWVARRDTNKDGLIDAGDGDGAPVLDAEGKPVRLPLAARFMFADPDGDGQVRSMTGVGPDGVGVLWKFKGLDADGVPVYEFGPDSVMKVKRPTIACAYDYSKTEDVRNQSESWRTADGRLLNTFQFGHSPRGMGGSNSGGTDLAMFNADGSMRWLRPMNDFAPIQGAKPMGQAFLTSWGHQCEWVGLDEDGLGLGRLGFPAAAEWTGMWVDHPGQYFTFRGNDGNLHVLVGDYMINGTHWLTLHHVDDYKKSRFPFKLDETAARGLGFRPPKPYQIAAKPDAPRVLVRKLPGPMPINGDLAKWRQAGITPQILMTPATASGDIDGPKDCSAVIRLAYEGNNLYVQVLRFDDVVTFHQPVSKSHLQDTTEIMLNGFFDGFQWSITRTTDAGDVMIRRRFFMTKLEELTPAEHAPRVIKVLDNAKDVSERSLIEAAYGIDMSDCKVIVTEFKLPIDKVTYHGSEESVFPVQSGATFWLGFLLCDNDVPGTDVQDLIVWPASYGTFFPKENGALAVFE